VRQTGGLDFGKDLDLHVEALAACDADHEVLDGAELMRRWPFFALDPGERVLYQPDGGISLADEAWHGFYDSAVRNGADMRQGVQVTSLEPHADGVRVVTTDGELHAGVAVVTAGAWARGLLEPAGIRLDTIPTRETVAFFAMEEAQDIPSIVDWGDPAVYALASPTPAGLKVGMHHAGPSTDPDRAGEPSDETVKSVSAWVRTRFPTADPRPLAVDTCIYTNTPDEDFVLERHGDIVVGSPCSGHGFKFAPLIGEQLAALALGESPESLS
jgi:sarcosine oxidase